MAEFTYPVSILYNFPAIPPDDIISALQASCATCFAGHAILGAITSPPPTPQRLLPPYFKLSLACLACAAGADKSSRSVQSDMVRKLFFAGNSLWNVMLEVDNTEARTLEGVLSVCIESFWRLSYPLLYNPMS